MTINSVGKRNANAQISNGNVDMGSGWSFSASDGNAILGENKDWNKYAKWFLAINSDYPEDTKEHYGYPFGKNGKVYRSAIIAIKQRSAAQGEQDIYGAASNLLDAIDKKRNMANCMEKRSFSCEFRTTEEGYLEGHAAIFNAEARIGIFNEKIIPGAFSGAINDDVRALFNHDPNIVLGRNRSGTLQLNEDSKGLYVKIFPPDTQIARDIVTSIKRGDISQMSFAFSILPGGDVWDLTGDVPLRSITKVKLYDVSPVTFPAYENTDVAVRSLDVFMAEDVNGIPDGTEKREVSYLVGLDLLRRKIQLFEKE